jgi:hypothetical protein
MAVGSTHARVELDEAVSRGPRAKEIRQQLATLQPVLARNEHGKTQIMLQVLSSASVKMEAIERRFAYRTLTPRDGKTAICGSLTPQRRRTDWSSNSCVVYFSQATPP